MEHFQKIIGELKQCRFCSVLQSLVYAHKNKLILPQGRYYQKIPQ